MGQQSANFRFHSNLICANGRTRHRGAAGIELIEVATNIVVSLSGDFEALSAGLETRVVIGQLAAMATVCVAIMRKRTAGYPPRYSDPQRLHGNASIPRRDPRAPV